MTVTTPEARPRFSWDHLQIDDDLGRVEGVIGADAVRAHAFAIGDDPERYLTGYDSGPFVPPTLLSNELLKLFFLGYDVGARVGVGLHTRSQIEYLEPVRIGEPVLITGRHIAKYVKRGRRYRSCLSTVERPEGTVLARMVATETVGYHVHDQPDEGTVPSDWAAGLPPIPAEPPADSDLIGPRNARISFEQSVLFSGLPFAWARDELEPVRQGTHTNPEAARAAGFGRPIAQGLLSASHLTLLLMDRFGDRVLRGATLSFAFIKPVLVQSDLTCHAVVTEPIRTGTGAFDTIQLVARLDDGNTATVGYGRIPR